MSDNDNSIEPVNVVLFAYSFFILVVGAIGNVFVLYAIKNCKVLIMNHVNLSFIGNLAVSDILYILSRVLTVMITNLTIEWKLGQHLCFASSMLATVSAIANVNFIAALTLYRLIMLFLPLSNNRITVKHVRFVCYGLWLYSCTLAIRSFFVKTTAVFVKGISTCIIQYQYHGIENLLYSILFLVSPFIIIIISNIILAVKTILYTRNIKANAQIRITKVGIKQMYEKRRKQATLTVGSLSLLLIVSWLPSFIKRFGGLKHTHPGLSKATIYLYFINSFGNPILYTLCSKDFKVFVRKKLLYWYGSR